MHNDDAPVGKILSRREVLALLGAGGAGLLGARVLHGAAPPFAARLVSPDNRAQLPACIVRPAQIEGPYFVDEKLQRSDIRADPGDGLVSVGTPLDLELRISRVTGTSCAPLTGALVDLWQCDALGVYSDVRDTAGRFDTRGRKFLRGYQVTDATGMVRFRTVYPGWYQGRAVHLHVKVRTPVAGGRHHDFTSQLYFDDALTATVFGTAPYDSKGGGWLRNDRDGIYRRGGSSLMLDTVRRGDGYVGTFDLGVQLG